MDSLSRGPLVALLIPREREEDRDRVRGRGGGGAGAGVRVLEQVRPGPRPVEAVLCPREVLGLAREAEVVISKVLQGFVTLLMTL